MSMALQRELEQLLEETNALLACPDFEFSLWEAYGVRRAAFFTRLQATTLLTEGEEHEVVSALIREILAQDALLIDTAQTRLSFLRSELAALATHRRALNGYASLSSATIFQCDA